MIHKKFEVGYIKEFVQYGLDAALNNITDVGCIS